MKDVWQMMITIGLSAGLLAVSQPAEGGVVFNDTFDSEAADTGDPDNYFTFGAQRTDRGVETSPFASSPNSAFMTLDYSIAGFGGGLVHDAITATTIDVLLSVLVRADTDESANLGTVGFRLEDADGTIVRTADADLFAPSTSFQTFSQSVAALTTVDAVGATAGLDTSNIVGYGLLFLDRNDVDDVVIYNVDNFIGTHSIPEPATASLMIIGLISSRWFVRKRR